MTSEPWQRVIDDAAHDMTTGVPASDFRARVMARVEATAPMRPTVAAWVWRGAMIAGAASIVAIAFSVMQPFRSTSPAGELVKSGVAPTTTPTVPAVPETTDVAVLAPTRQRPAPALQPPASLLDWRSRNIPGLIQPVDLSISQLSVTPLEIAPIVVAPIDPLDPLNNER